MAAWVNNFSFFPVVRSAKCHWPIRASSLKSHSPAGRIYSPLASRRVLMNTLILPGAVAAIRYILGGGALDTPSPGRDSQTDTLLDTTYRDPPTPQEETWEQAARQDPPTSCEQNVKILPCPKLRCCKICIGYMY